MHADDGDSSRPRLTPATVKVERLEDDGEAVSFKKSPPAHRLEPVMRKSWRDLSVYTLLSPPGHDDAADRFSVTARRARLCLLKLLPQFLKHTAAPREPGRGMSRSAGGSSWRPSTSRPTPNEATPQLLGRWPGNAARVWQWGARRSQ